MCIDMYIGSYSKKVDPVYFIFNTTFATNLLYNVQSSLAFIQKEPDSSYQWHKTIYGGFKNV